MDLSKQATASAVASPRRFISHKEWCRILAVHPDTLLAHERASGSRLPRRIRIGGSVKFDSESCDRYLELIAREADAARITEAA